MLDRSICVFSPNTWWRPLWASVGSQMVENMVPKVSSLVETFVAAMGIHACPLMLSDRCWPVLHDEMPVQDLKGIKEGIVHRLDKVVMQSPSTIAWDRFCIPHEMDQKYWQEEVLCHYPGKVLDVSAHMPGIPHDVTK